MTTGLILEFETLEAAQIALDAINDLSSQWWSDQGGSVFGGALIGRNAATGQDEPDKTATAAWAEILESPDGTFYFPSPSQNPRFAAWQALVSNGIEKPFPEEWITMQDMA